MIKKNIPLLVLGLAIFALFLSMHRKAAFLPGHHGFVSSHGLAISNHFSASDGGLMYSSKWENEEGELVYEVYNRFPFASFAAIRLVTAPFDHTLRSQVLAARYLMTFFLAAAMILAYLSILRLSDNKWLSLAVVLLCFSSYFTLYYHDLIFNDIPSLFGLLLVFHAMLIFKKEGRYVQLMWKSMLALLLGWQVYALLLPFVLLGMFQTRRSTRGPKTVLSHPYLKLGLGTLVFGLCLLALNFYNEARVTSQSLSDISSFKMMLWRLGLGSPDSYEGFLESLNWLHFVYEQFVRIGLMITPYYLSLFLSNPLLSLLGFSASVASLLLIYRFKGDRHVLLSLVLSGFVWSIPMRHFVAFHDFQSLYYIGVPMVFFSLVILLIKEKQGELLPILAGLALFLLLLSTLHMNRSKEAQSNEILLGEFQQIKSIIGSERRIFVDGDFKEIGGSRHSLAFFLSRNYFQLDRSRAEYILSDKVQSEGVLRSPENSLVLVYDLEKAN